MRARLCPFNGADTMGIEVRVNDSRELLFECLAIGNNDDLMEAVATLVDKTCDLMCQRCNRERFSRACSMLYEVV